MSCPSPRPVAALAAGQPFVVQNVGATDTLTQLRAAVADLENELVQAQRRVVLGDLAAMIAHELNNLMTSVLGRADFALHTGQVPDMRKALEHTRRQVNQAMTVMGRLLRFAQPHSGPAECCGLAAAVQEALDTATRPLEKDAIALSVTVPAGVWVSAPRELLVQVLLNLVLNARQAMAGGRGRLGISARVEDNRVLIEICDTGHGIPGDRLASVINPFLAGGADQPSPWTTVGLGLNVCRMIARHCGATIQAAANADGGCTFRLHWPGGTNRSEPRP